MKVVILCGGQGTRLREETEYRPKPLVDVGGKPILWHIMKLYQKAGLNEFVLCLGYKAQMIKDYFLNYEALNNDFTIELGDRSKILYHGQHDEQDFKITAVDTGLESMTGGRVKRVAKHLDGDFFCVTYGDGVCDVDIERLLYFHRLHGKKATITTVRPTSRFGILDLDPSGQVTRFQEKPQVDGWASAGFMVLHRSILDTIDGDLTVLEKEPLEKLAADGQLVAYRHEGFFFAMDTYRDYLALNELWNTGQAPWKVWQEAA